jgi:non-homologous end joining protein Ku
MKTATAPESGFDDDGGCYITVFAEKVTKDMLDLAKHIVDTKKAHFEPGRFEDHYEEALKELLKKKQFGQKIEVPREREPSKVVNLMDALRRSVESERRRTAQARAQRWQPSCSEEGWPFERAGEEG